MAKKDYYEVLGVDEAASTDEIKKSYRQLTLKHHPDKGGDAEKFHEIQEAYEHLVNDNKRKEYDQFGFDMQSNTSGYSQTYSNAWEMFANLNKDLRSNPFFSNLRNQHTVKINKPINLKLILSFMEAINGTKIKFNFKRKTKCLGCNGTGKDSDSEKIQCPTCGGIGSIRKNRGFISFAQACTMCMGVGTIIKKPCKTCGGKKYVLDKKRLEVDIPAGIKNNQSINIPREGHQDLEILGDLLIHITVSHHEYFVRIQNHIQIHMTISMTQSLLGSTIKIPTIHGYDVDLEIPKLSKDGTMLLIKNEGIKKEGHMRVVLHTTIPEELTEKEIEILKKLENELQSDKEPSPIPLNKL